MMSKFMAKMREVVLMKRWMLLGANLILAMLLLAVALIDHTTWMAAADFVVAGFMLCHFVHGLQMPGVMTVWHEIEQQNIKGQLEKQFAEIIERHNEAQDDQPGRKLQ